MQKIEISDDPKQVSNAAIRYEEEGYRILTDAGASARDPLSKSTFEFLANQELQHIAIIKSYVESISGGAEFDPTSISAPINRIEAKEQIKGIFARYKPQYEAAAALDEGRMEVYNVAMDMERLGYDLYTEAADKAKDDTARKMYRFLANEETRHYGLIQETVEFLKQPDAIMAVEERWMQI